MDRVERMPYIPSGEKARKDPAGTAYEMGVLLQIDDNSTLNKTKARLVVRGDLQRVFDIKNTRALTLAARSLRMLMALTAAFDIDAIPLDVKNAFINAHLADDEKIYAAYTEGFKCSNSNTVLQLKRALYGLRRCPVLWQQKLTNSLESFGFRQLNEDNCVFTNGTVIVFVYVDDICLLAPREDRPRLESRRQQLKSVFHMSDMGDLQWFLNIPVARNRQKRTLWLVQDSYIGKITG